MHKIWDKLLGKPNPMVVSFSHQTYPVDLLQQLHPHRTHLVSPAPVQQSQLLQYAYDVTLGRNLDLYHQFCNFIENNRSLKSEKIGKVQRRLDKREYRQNWIWRQEKIWNQYWEYGTKRTIHSLHILSLSLLVLEHKNHQRNFVTWWFSWPLFR